MLYKKLKYFERRVIGFSMFIRKQYLRRNRMNKSQNKRFLSLFRKNHILFYLLLIRPGFTKNSVNLVINFALCRIEENLRLFLLSRKYENSVGFYSAVRSQLELVAFLDYCIKDQEYLQKYLTKDEDRSDKKNPNLVKNIFTLIQKMDNKDEKVKNLYEYISILLHPNPSAIFEALNFRVGHPETRTVLNLGTLDMYLEHIWWIDEGVQFDFDIWVKIMCQKISETFTKIRKIKTIQYENKNVDSIIDIIGPFIESKNIIRKKCGFPAREL